jgi:excisionase family DNA binding protein
MTQSISPTADVGRLATTYRGASRSLGVCERTIWQLVKNGELKAIRIGRSVRIPIAELERFIADQAKQG